jgi:PAS domain S-box-containing protein
MPSPVRILHLEDDPIDCELISSTLRHEGLDCAIQWVSNRADFESAVAQGAFEVILADYHLPGFDGQAALALCRQLRSPAPFLFVSGFMGEEVALESLKDGATDYVFKHNLARLVPAVRRALQEAKDQRQRRQAEAALQESESALRSFFHTAPFMMGIVELLPDDLLHLSANAASARFLGTNPEAMCGCRSSQLGVPGEVIAQWLDQVREAHRRQAPVQSEFTCAMGDRTCQLSATVSELPGPPGQAPRFCYVAEDVTAKKQLELQFLRAQRLESIGTLASGIAHDLNNVLAPIIMSLKLFRPKLTDPDDQELLLALDSSARRGADIVRQVLTFARGVEGARQPVDLRRLVGEIEKIARDTFPRSIQIRVSVDDELGRVVGDSTQIYQVLMNLCVNARDAMPNGGCLTLAAENVVFDDRTARLHPDARPGCYVAVSVFDSGGGIPPELMPRIFDPFFTTKDVGKGTGLGLPTALTIVKSHGGFINVDSEIGRGTEFKFYLPCAAGVDPIRQPSAPLPIPHGGGELILVVDDESTIRQVTKATLMDHGYDVITASNGAEAVALFAREKGRIKLVVTDMMMPLMDGMALIQTLQKMDRHVRIIAVSGLLDGHAPPQAPQTVRVVFLQKPFTAEQLLLAVSELLQCNDAPLLL